MTKTSDPPRALRGATLGRDLFVELARDRFSGAAWRRFARRGWERAREAVHEDPPRTRSFLRWALLGALLGVAALLVAARAHPGGGWALRGVLWGVWYLAVSGAVLVHLGMVQSEEGVPWHTLLLPNGLTFLRLGLAPFFCSVLDAAGTRGLPGQLLCIFLAVIAGTDLLDGFLARSLGLRSRLGRMLDPPADMALLVALALGLHAHGRIPTLLLVLLLVRYLGTLIAGVVLTYLRGPVEVRHTLLGRIASFSASILLVAAAVELLTAPRWMPHRWVELGLELLQGLFAVNIVYFLWIGLLRPRPGAHLDLGEHSEKQ